MVGSIMEKFSKIFDCSHIPSCAGFFTLTVHLPQYKKRAACVSPIHNLDVEVLLLQWQTVMPECLILHYL